MGLLGQSVLATVKKKDNQSILSSLDTFYKKHLQVLKPAD